MWTRSFQLLGIILNMPLHGNSICPAELRRLAALPLYVVLATGPGSDQINGSVRFQNCPKTRPVTSWRAKPGPVPINLRVLPGLARPVGSNLRFCVSGFSIYGRI